MRRIVIAVIWLALSCVTAFAGPIEDSIVRQLRAQGFDNVGVSRTFLGRTRIKASRGDIDREIVVNPSTGEILRDYSVRKGKSVPLIGSPSGSSNSGSRSGSGSGTSVSDDDDSDDDEDDKDDKDDDKDDDRDDDKDDDRDDDNDDDRDDDNDDDRDDDNDDRDNSGSGNTNDD